jgi:hypothetical protein
MILALVLFNALCLFPLHIHFPEAARFNQKSCVAAQSTERAAHIVPGEIGQGV